DDVFDNETQTMAVDPICGMTVAESSPLRADRDGQTYFFCSEHCRKTFVSQAEAPPHGPAHLVQLEDPAHQEGHACCHHDHHGHDGAEAVVASAAAKYFCPMCPGVEADKPGDCPVCGMALERNPAWRGAAPTETVYTCPM